MSRNEVAEKNRRNAARSTGPRTPGGKAKSRLNAVSHGLRSTALVLPGERASDWEAHRDGVAASLSPAGALEQDLACRIASLLWRLRRVTAFEAGHVDIKVLHDEVAPAFPAYRLWFGRSPFTSVH